MKVIVSTLARLGCSVVLLIVCCLPLTAQQIDYAKWVNPFIGTGGHGHTFPGATMPFGMVQLSPDTRTDNWDGSSGYHYSDDIIYGFSHTHLSGTGIPDYCDLLFMPTVGEPQFFAKEGDKSVNGSSSKFSHANEKAEPGYYSVKLDDDGILAEMTATPRVGLHRYTFPDAGEANIHLNLRWRDRLLDTQLSVVGKNRIEGFRRSSSWAKDQIIYFVAEFSRDFDSFKSEPQTNTGADERARPIRQNVAFQFRTRSGEKILVKVAISAVSIEGARKNLEAELPGWDFDKVRADARAAWNRELSKIEVSGGTDAQMTNFYTALYHTMIQPNIFNDVDGNYRGHDGKTHNISDDVWSPGFSRPDAAKKPPKGGTPSDEYTVFSLWDTFRAAHPLYTIIDQRRTVDFINTFIRQYEQGGRLPVWELAGNETDCMIGYHAVSVIADAMAKGIEGFDYEKAYAAAKHSAELDHYGLAAYKKRGYISMEDENESVSKTLEYAYDDWCIAEMSKIMGQRYEAWLLTVNKALQSDLPEKLYAADYEKYSKRARSFENLFDPSTGFMRPKKNGGFVSPFAPNEVTFNFTEGNSWVYSFFVPQDVPRLMALHGGPQQFAAKLDALFSTTDKLAGREQPDITGLIGQYAHGNEPSHHIAYLYDYAGQPWKTQEIVRRIMDEFYKPQPDGLIGNEDCGQMSAWFIMSALGLYEVTPGEPAYAIGTPLFAGAKIRLENGKAITIKAPGASSRNKYVKSVRVNGRLLDRAFVDHSELMNGATLEFEMSDRPVKTAMATPMRHGDVLQEHDSFVAVPVIEAEKNTFRGSMKIGLSSITPDTRIFYTTDGSEPTKKSTRFDSSISINKTTTVKAIAVNDQGDASKTVDATFHLIPNDWTVKIDSKYNRQYTGGGDEGLIDGIRGTKNFASGEWQGYQGQDFVATIDLQKKTIVREVGGSFLQVAGSWIWLPTQIVFEASDDGVTFTKVAGLETHADVHDMEARKQEYLFSINPVYSRYIRIHAYNLGKIPAWHPGAGSDAFIFVDEIIVR
jgi:predicted alpha-1,2-mannosidase